MPDAGDDRLDDGRGATQFELSSTRATNHYNSTRPVSVPLIKAAHASPRPDSRVGVDACAQPLPPLGFGERALDPSK